jgi:hypothetical protein
LYDNNARKKSSLHDQNILKKKTIFIWSSSARTVLGNNVKITAVIEILAIKGTLLEYH